MTISTFRFGSRQSAIIKLPVARAEASKWQPQVHDRFPDFTAPTTKGEIEFSDWAAGRWIVLVSHPAAFTPVCTSEIATLAKRQPEFDDRNVKLMALTGDPLERLQRWTAEIEATYDVDVTFPHVADAQGTIAKGCGLLQDVPLLGGNFCARRTFLISPDGMIRMILDYPVTVGRSVDEILRVLDAMILAEKLEALAPADWQLGEPMMLLHPEARPDLIDPIDPEPEHRDAYFCSDFNLKEIDVHRPRSRRLPPVNEWDVKKLDKRQRGLVITRLAHFADH